MQSPTRITPSAPVASAVRMMVPRLPGSRTRSSATHRGEPRPDLASGVVRRCSKAPRTICGLSLRLIRPSRDSVIGRARPPSRSSASSSGRTCRSFSRPARKARRCSRQPSDTASVQIRVPSARNQPVWRRYFRSCNARRRFTSAFAALVIGSGRFKANISCHNKTIGKPIFCFDCDPFLRT